MPLYGNNSCLVNSVTVNSTQVTQFITESPVPVIEIMKLAYTLQEPSLVADSSKVIAAGSLLYWMQSILNGINTNIYVGRQYVKVKNSGANKVYMLLLQAYAFQARTVLSYFQKKDTEYKSSLVKLIAKLNTLNKAWVAQLSSAGLMGNYNFSKHLQ